MLAYSNMLCYYTCVYYYIVCILLSAVYRIIMCKSADVKYKFVFASYVSVYVGHTYCCILT